MREAINRYLALLLGSGTSTTTERLVSATARQLEKNKQLAELLERKKQEAAAREKLVEARRVERSLCDSLDYYSGGRFRISAKKLIIVVVIVGLFVILVKACS